MDATEGRVNFCARADVDNAYLKSNVKRLHDLAFAPTAAPTAAPAPLEEKESAATMVRRLLDARPKERPPKPGASHTILGAKL
jgi:hypothetical protein